MQERELGACDIPLYQRLDVCWVGIAAGLETHLHCRTTAVNCQ
jgi:hypothetical protein